MKPEVSRFSPKRNLHLFIACLLSFSMTMLPFVQIASAMSVVERSAPVKRDRKAGNSGETKTQRSSVNEPIPAPAPEPFLVPNITATKTDAIINDDGDSKLDPGGAEKIEYTVTITNNGTDATNVTFSDTIDAHTTLVGGSVQTQPIAANDSYSVLGNVRIQVPDGANDLLANDIDPDTGNNTGLTISALAGDNSAPFSGTSAQGGNVTANTTDGSFQYNPAPGFTGTDTFTYTVTDPTGKTDTATVTLTVSGMIWFINSGSGVNGDGRLTSPFNCYTGIGCFSNVAADDPGDNIFLYNGTYTGGNPLLLNQKLIGQGAKDSLQNIAGVSVPTFSDPLPATNSNPGNVTISTGLAAVNVINVNQGNTLRGFTVGNVGAGGGGIVGTNFGTLAIGGSTAGSADVAINSNGQALGLNTGAIANQGFTSVTSTGGASNILLSGVTGTLNLGTGALSGASQNSFDINGGSVSTNYSGGISKTSGTGAMVNVLNHATGTLTFQTGTLNATAGTGLQFSNADGTYNFAGTNTLNGGDAGIDILNGSSGSFTFSASSTITSPSGTAFNVGTSPGNPSVTYSGSITDNTAGQRAVNIDGTTGGTITINSVTAASTAGGVGNTGININNANGNVTFTTLNLGTSGTRMTAQALTVNGGTGTYGLGTISILTNAASGIVATNADGTLNVTTGSVDSSGATAINIDGPAGLTTLGMTLTSVTSAGGTADGISIQDTNGSFTVNGDGSNTSAGGNGTGGTISNKSGTDGVVTAGIGIYLNNVQNITLRRVSITGVNQNFGIRGFSVNNFTLEYSTVGSPTPTNSATIAANLQGTNTGGIGEGAIYFGNQTDGVLGLTGVGTFTSNFISAGRIDNMQLSNGGGTLDRLNITGSTFGYNSAALPAANAALTVVARRASVGNTVLNSTVTGNTFVGSPGNAANFTGQEPTLALGISMDTIFQNNTISNNHANNNIGGCNLTIAGFSNNTFNVSNNNMTGANGSALTLQLGAPIVGSTVATSISGTINNNIIGNAAVANSGSASGNGIFLSFADNLTAPKGVATIAITNNVIHQYHGNAGIFADNTGGNYNVNATITGNTTDTPGAGAFAGLALSAGAPGPDDIDVCAAVTGNNFSAGDPANANDIFVIVSGTASSMRLPGYSGSNLNQVATFIKNNNLNPATTIVTAQDDNGNGTTAPSFSGGAAPCTLPTTAPEISSTMRSSERTGSTAQSLDATTSRSPQTAMTITDVTNAPLAKARSSSTVVAAPRMISTNTTASSRTAEIKSAQSTASSRVVTKGITGNSDVSPSEVGTPRRAIRAHHAKISRVFTPTMSGETVNVNIGTLRAGDSVTITFQVTLNNPPNLTLLNPARVRNQGTVTADGGISVLTDDTAVGGATDPTDTPVDLFDTSTNLISSLNPSNQGDQVTFTATVSETPAQGSVDPTGTVDFIDTNNGNAVICDDVPLVSGSAQCQTSALTAATHNIRADYSGDGNFDPSQSNVVAQVVNACSNNPVVTSTADNGAGTLREALANICTGNTITFNIAGPGPHTITLTTGELAVTKDVTINNNSGKSITISGNNASRVFNINTGKTASIIGLTMTGGASANDAGAILNDGALTIVNSTLSGNAAVNDGGAINSSATATSLTLINTTISGNTAALGGGGVFVGGGTATTINSTITNNTADSDNNGLGAGGGILVQAGTVTLKNTIVAGNFNEDGASDAADDISGTVDAASSFNLIGTGGAGGLTNGVNNNQVGVASPGLGGLASNGGTTQTHVLLPTSPAVDAGSNANLPTDTFDLDSDANTAETLPVDQRGAGFARVVGAAVDIGSLEANYT
jgi:hypothetical protein